MERPERSIKSEATIAKTATTVIGGISSDQPDCSNPSETHMVAPSARTSVSQSSQSVRRAAKRLSHKGAVRAAVGAAGLVHSNSAISAPLPSVAPVRHVQPYPPVQEIGRAS